MKSYKKIQAIALGAVSLILVGVILAINLSKAPEQVRTEVVKEERAHSIGVAADLEEAQALMFSTRISVEKSGEEMVAAALAVKSNLDDEDDLDEDDVEDELEEEDIAPVLVENDNATTQKSASQAWANRVMANVSDFLAIRKRATSSSEELARMLPDTVVTLVEKGNSWTKVKSGKITGYVYTKYCVFGNDAYAQYKKNCKKYAVAKSGVESLNVRKSASFDSEVVTTMVAGDKLEYVAESGLSPEWVAVKYKGKTRYVAAKYVKIKQKWSKPTKHEEETYEDHTGKADDSEIVNAPYKATKEEKKLLAAIIQCEAGYVSKYSGKVAVGAVVLNRVRSSRWPNTIKEVIYQRGQFTPASSGSLQRVLDNGLSVADCMDAAEDALKGVDPTNGAQSFTYASSGKKGVVIGTVVFY